MASWRRPPAWARRRNKRYDNSAREGNRVNKHILPIDQSTTSTRSEDARDHVR
jgi:hypothetical protein